MRQDIFGTSFVLTCEKQKARTGVMMEKLAWRVDLESKQRKVKEEVTKFRGGQKEDLRMSESLGHEHEIRWGHVSHVSHPILSLFY